MKKWKILIPSLLATVSTPLVSMVGCDDPNTKQWLVQFNTNGGSFINSVRVEDGKTIKEPPTPTQKGYQFDGWFKDPDFQDDFEFSEPIKGNLTIYVRWKKDVPSNTLIFSTDGNCRLEFDTLNVPAGTKWSNLVASGKLPKVEATKTGYEFDGWYLNNIKLEDDYDLIITSDWFINVRFSNSVKTKAYIATELTGIELSNINVTIGQPYETDIVRTGGTIDKDWVKSVVNGSEPATVTITQKDEYTLHLNITKALGDILIIINDRTNYQSYLCNDPDEGYSITDNVISVGNPVIGKIHSSKNTIDKEEAMGKITMNNVEIPPENYDFVVNPSNPYEATISIKNIAITNNVFIWMAPLSISYDSEVDPELPFTIDPLPEGTDPEVAQNKFYEWIASNRKRYLEDVIVGEFVPSDSKLDEEVKITINLDDLDFTVSQDKTITCNFKFSLLEYITGGEDVPEVFTLERIEAKGIKAKLDYNDVEGSDEGYTLYPVLGTMTIDEMYYFLKNGDEWSVDLVALTNSGNQATSASKTMMQDISLEEWEQSMYFIIATLYSIGCFPHPIYYLSNIAAPESK